MPSPADTNPQTTPIARPIASSAGVDGSVRPALGLRPSRIWVAPAKTVSGRAGPPTTYGAVVSSVPAVHAYYERLGERPAFVKHVLNSTP